jgi:ethanolamine ammonia-lyase large subunit
VLKHTAVPGTTHTRKEEDGGRCCDGLTALDEIYVPGGDTAEYADAEEYSLTVAGTEEVVRFRGLKQLLAAADFPKAGDAHLFHATSDVEREAARSILSALTLQHLYDRPLLVADGGGGVDSVMRVNYDIDRKLFASVARWTVGELKDYILAHAAEEETVRLGATALTGVMVSAAAKLMDVHELVYAARMLPRKITRARTELGAPGTLSSRLQPNHQVDDPDGIKALVLAGLSLGTGDCLLGLNPAIDNVRNISRALRTLDAARRRLNVPTQICVLAHIRTQMACLEEGAPVEVLFQSIAGTDRCLTEFDISVPLLDEAFAAMTRDGVLAVEARERGEPAPPPNFMYFETGQGSAASLCADNGIDMLTCEALAYGLARRYRPFMVNSVTGFIGPETHRSSQELIVAALQDNFCAKLMGLPFGCDPCYTNHSDIALEAQQMTTELLTAAGTGFFMDVYLGVDRMLGYYTTSGHDNETLREVYGRRPQSEYARWAIARGIYAETADGKLVRGPKFGDPRALVESDDEWERMVHATSCAYGLENAGPRPANAVSRANRLAQALCRRTVRTELDVDSLRPFLGENARLVRTTASSKETHLYDNKLGASLMPDDLARISRERESSETVQIIVSDGLSADAIAHNIPILLPALRAEFAARGVSMSSHGVIVARYGRVKLAEIVAGATGARLVINLIGERPGGDIASSRSMSAYLAYAVGPGKFEWTVINSVYPDSGLPPDEAARRIGATAFLILRYGAAGNRLIRILSDEGVDIATV